jgi:hypothetical protein
MRRKAHHAEDAGNKRNVPVFSSATAGPSCGALLDGGLVADRHAGMVSVGTKAELRNGRMMTGEANALARSTDSR